MRFFVSGLRFDCAEEDIREAFERLTKVSVVSVAIPRDRNDFSRGRGFAFVETTSDDVTVHVLLDLDGAIVGTKCIKVVLDSQQAPKRDDDKKSLNIMLNKRLTRCGSVREVLLIFGEHADDFNHVNYATAAHRLAKLWKKPSKGKQQGLFQAVEALVERATRSVIEEQGVWGSRELANLVWAVATMDFKSPSLFEAIACSAKLETYNPQALANTAWAFAKQQHAGTKDFWSNLARESAGKMEHFSAQEQANTVWAFAKCVSATSGPHADLFAAMARWARVGDFNAQNVANTVWAFASRTIERLDSDGEAFFEAVARKLLDPNERPLLTEFSPQNLTHVAWSYARLNSTMRTKQPLLFKAIAKAAIPMVHEFTTQELSSLAWAIARARVFMNDKEQFVALFKAVEAASLLLIRRFTPRNLANSCWAYATTSEFYNARELLEAIAEAALPKLNVFNEQELANTACAFANISNKCGLVAGIAEEVNRRGTSGFTPQGLAKTAWAFAKIKLPCLSIQVAAESKIGRFHASDLSTLAFALASSQPAESAHFLLGPLAEEAAARSGQFKPEEIANLCWALATVKSSKKQQAQFDEQWEVMLLPEARGALAAAFEELAPCIVRLLHSGHFRLKEITQIAWAYARANHFANPEVFEALAAAIINSDHSFEPASLCEAAWAFLVAKRRRFRKVMKVIASVNVEKLDASQLASLATTFAAAKIRAVELIEDILKAILECDADLEHLIQTHLAASFLLGPDGGENMRNLALKACKCLMESDGQRTLLGWSCVVAGMVPPTSLHLEAVISSEQDEPRLEELRRFLGTSRRLQRSREEPCSRRRQREVGEALTRVIGFKKQEEEGPDFTASSSEQLGLMVDGEERCLVDLDGSKFLNGPTRFRERLLTQAGWRLVRLDADQWDAQRDDRDRDALLKSLLTGSKQDDEDHQMVEPCSLSKKRGRLDDGEETRQRHERRRPEEADPDELRAREYFEGALGHEQDRGRSQQGRYVRPAPRRDYYYPPRREDLYRRRPDYDDDDHRRMRPRHREYENNDASYQRRSPPPPQRRRRPSEEDRGYYYPNRHAPPPPSPPQRQRRRPSPEEDYYYSDRHAPPPLRRRTRSSREDAHDDGHR